jgi:BirA family transcriptional regulator, biotin operon repressor / biotin---[acetyl-CoA-carboxylase] ligase
VTSPSGRRQIRPLAGSSAFGRPLVHLDETTSTNDRARELAIAGAPSGTVVLAEAQSAGRGRQGRSWTAPRGSGLTLSALVRFDSPADRALALLPLAAALAVCEACEAVARVTCAIKWPNDVQARGRKLAGILTEARPQSGWAVVGIGLNVNVTSDELDHELRATATSLRIETGEEIDRRLALELLLARAGSWVSREAGAESLLDAYRERDALYGKRIGWNAGGARQAGEARGIDDEGRLVVYGDAGEPVVLEAGEVHLESVDA